MRKRLLVLSLIVSLALLSGCSTTAACYMDGVDAETLRTVYVVRRGWHTGIVVQAADWPDRSSSLLTEFPDADYLEFGWGDERFYQDENATFWMAVRAALWPTSSVIHVIGLRAPLDAHINANELVEFRVSAEGLAAMAVSIADEFEGGTLIRTGAWIGVVSAPNQFYEAKRRFFFPRMCNWWTAKQLQEAGCPIQPQTVVAASRVTREARGFAAGEQGRY